MYTIEYVVPSSGRKFEHRGTEDGIRQLVTRELLGCPWKFIGRKFDWNKKTA